MFQENPDKLSDIVEEELSEDEARNAREDRKMLRQELFRMFQENPDNLSVAEKDLLVVLETESYLDTLIEEQRWIWGTLVPALHKINNVVDDYKVGCVNSDLGRIPIKDDLKYLNNCYSTTWFSDYITKLHDRANIIEKTLARDIEIILYKLFDAVFPEWREDAEIPEKAYPPGELLITPEAAKLYYEDPEYIVREEWQAQYEEDQD
jgi:hypothetical protein